MNSEAIQIGDRVSFSYHGISLTGRVSGFSGRGVMVKCSFEAYGSQRDGAWLDGEDLATMRLLEKSPTNDCFYVQGHTFSRSL